MLYNMKILSNLTGIMLLTKNDYTIFLLYTKVDIDGIMTI